MTRGDPQKRGYEVEALLRDLFTAREIPFRASYRASTGQIDGAVKYEGLRLPDRGEVAQGTGWQVVSIFRQERGIRQRVPTTSRLLTELHEADPNLGGRAGHDSSTAETDGLGWRQCPIPIQGRDAVLRPSACDDPKDRRRDLYRTAEVLKVAADRRGERDVACDLLGEKADLGRYVEPLGSPEPQKVRRVRRPHGPKDERPAL